MNENDLLPNDLHHSGRLMIVMYPYVTGLVRRFIHTVAPHVSSGRVAAYRPLSWSPRWLLLAARQPPVAPQAPRTASTLC